ncbi:MAG TPA: hypothetical protein VMH81_37625 [Bryobacteraceae bacterium]|nr:hypothetical protein [Bryobacteraceae bacterium]
MNSAAELYRFHTAYVIGFLAFVVVFALAQWRGRGPGMGGRE